MKPEEKKKLYNALLITISFLLVCWALFLSDELLGADIKHFGLRPRKVEGLIGIVSVHFLHSNWEHILNNTWAFFTLNLYFFFFYRSVAYKTFPIMLIASAALLWLWGRDGNHIGASVVIYSLSSFLFFSGLFRKSLPLMAVSGLVVFSYGSMLWGIFPIRPEMSWEGHLAGGVVGLLISYYYREEGPQRKKYQWELDEEREQRVFEATTYEEITLEEAEEFMQSYGEEIRRNPFVYSSTQSEWKYSWKPSTKKGKQ